MKNDLMILKSAWQNLHPGIYRYNTKEEFERMFDNAQQACKVSMPAKKFYLLIAGNTDAQMEFILKKLIK